MKLFFIDKNTSLCYFTKKDILANTDIDEKILDAGIKSAKRRNQSMAVKNPEDTHSTVTIVYKHAKKVHVVYVKSTNDSFVFSSKSAATEFMSVNAAKYNAAYIAKNGLALNNQNESYVEVGDGMLYAPDISAKNVKAAIKTLSVSADSDHYEEIEIGKTISDMSNMTKGKRWTVETTPNGDMYYTWLTKHQEKMKIPVEFADKLFLEFSKHGLDMSGAQVQFKNNLSPREWNSLKSNLNLYKDSDIFSPHTREGFTAAEYRKIAARKMEELEALQKGIVVDEYQKRKLKQAKKWEREANEKLYNRAMFDEELTAYVQQTSVTPITVSKIRDAKSGKLRLLISDLHIGQDVFAKLIGANYNSEVIREMLQEALADVMQDIHEEVELWILGDIIESITGTMHPGVWKEMEPGMYGIALYKLAHAILREFIGAIPNLTKVRALGGNHDRMTDDKRHDTECTIAGIMFYQLEQEFALAGIEIHFDHDVQVFDDEGIRYILFHGDAGMRNKPKDIISMYGDQRMYNVIIIGDRHTRAVTLDQHNGKMIILPPFTIGNKYSQDLGFTSMPGYTKLHHRTFENGVTLPYITDCPLPLRATHTNKKLKASDLA